MAEKEQGKKQVSVQGGAKAEKSIMYEGKSVFYAKGRGLSRYIAASSPERARAIAEKVIGKTKLVSVGKSKVMPQKGEIVAVEVQQDDDFASIVTTIK